VGIWLISNHSTEPSLVADFGDRYDYDPGAWLWSPFEDTLIFTRAERNDPQQGIWMISLGDEAAQQVALPEGARVIDWIGLGQDPSATE
jgi:hypothetical protein